MTRQDRRVLRGQLTRRIVTQESMSSAINNLLSDTQRYVIVVNQKGRNRQSGKPQSPVEIINEGEPVALGGRLDTRLRYSRGVKILLVQDDGGVGAVDLSLRTWESWSRSSSLTTRMLSFNRSLLEGACTRFVGPSPALLAMLAPVYLCAIAFFSWALSTPSNRRAAFDTTSATQNITTPAWLTDFLSISIHLWPVFIFLAAFIYIAYGMSGSLRVWPEALTNNSISQAIFDFRRDFVKSKTLISIMSGIIGGILVAVFTYFIL